MVVRMRCSFRFSVVWLLVASAAAQDLRIDVPEQFTGTRRFEAEPDGAGTVTCWLPDGPDALVVPFSAGVEVDTAVRDAMAWLERGSPWELLELPLIGARYGDRTLACIVPWPHYATLVVGERVGIRFSMPERRHDAAPCVVLAQWTGPEPLAIARVFRQWRSSSDELGVVPRPKSLRAKIDERPEVARLLGASHFYLWGNARFSRHDVRRDRWCAFAKAIVQAPGKSPLGRLHASFSDEVREATQQLAASEWPEQWRTRQVAGAIDAALGGPAPDELVQALRGFDGVRPPATWGDGISQSMLDSLQDAGVDRAVLLTSDLYRDGIRADVAEQARRLGYLFGPYDSYHSVHRPGSPADATWETAQFDHEAFEQGRVIGADGVGNSGFKGRGFHFAPAAAWPYVQERVGGMCAAAPFSTWFVDCDATGQCFEDYRPERPATRGDDLRLRRERLTWLADQHELVVGSEGGSVLFADVVDFGHGVDTPYVGHLDPALRDRDSEYFLGRHWPPDAPEQSFAPVPIVPSLRSPYFDPRRRVPLYRAAIGDELVTSHHWSFDSLKLSDVAGDRELLELLVMTPPMYHVSRGTFANRRATIARHHAFFGPVHRVLATAPLTRFEHLSPDRLLQRATYRVDADRVTVTVNFATDERAGHPARSVTVGGLELDQPVYIVR